MPIQILAPAHCIQIAYYRTKRYCDELTRLQYVCSATGCSGRGEELDGITQVYPGCPYVVTGGGPNGCSGVSPVPPQETERWISDLLEAGVHRVCCLLREPKLELINMGFEGRTPEPGRFHYGASVAPHAAMSSPHPTNHSSDYRLLSIYVELFSEENVCWSPTWPFMASIRQLRDEIFPFLDESVLLKKRVLFHDSTGHGRAANVMLNWLIYHHGLTYSDAQQWVLSLGGFPSQGICVDDDHPEQSLTLKEQQIELCIKLRRNRPGKI